MQIILIHLCIVLSAFSLGLTIVFLILVLKYGFTNKTIVKADFVIALTSLLSCVISSFFSFLLGIFTIRKFLLIIMRIFYTKYTYSILKKLNMESGNYETNDKKKVMDAEWRKIETDDHEPSGH